MVLCVQYTNYQQLHSLKLTARILTHLATQPPAIPGRHKTKPTRLPGIRSLFTTNDKAGSPLATDTAILPPLQCAVGLMNLGSPIAEQSPVASPAKPMVGSPTSPGMTPISPIYHGATFPEPSTISPKTRRPLSLHDLLSAEAPPALPTRRSKNPHQRRQCGISDCHNDVPVAASSSRRLGVGNPPPDALSALRDAPDSPLYWSENDGLLLLPQSELEAAPACQDRRLDKLRERRNSVELRGGEGEQKKEQVEDSLNVDELSELFSYVEQEEISGVDYRVFIEDEDAINVEEISQMFSWLEDSKTCVANDRVEVTTSSPVDVVDTKELEMVAADVEMSLDIFGDFDDITVSQEREEADVENMAGFSEVIAATLEDKDATEPVQVSYTVTDCEDAKNVDLVADLFTSLEASGAASQDEVANRSAATRDWIDALEVDNVSSLFTELEQTEKMETQMVPPAPKVDSRIFVPTFSVRIDGQRSGRRPAVGPNSDLLVGPPGVLLAGPPAPSSEDRIGCCKSKRKTRSFVTKQPDPSISDTRRASAAKRQRVKGRFVSDSHTFVSITALQQ
ncbi:hypothetical protein PF005_g21679 [Phytophthora fragariae]|uniref:CCT domain-containing protein n=1 Tax=Phytophthora fragariae TaxID=53985 RepID=A0A6A3WJ36_9STRA|nr:hypothetical protein PF005_g21679 [Phytophthora fragariae]